MSNGIAAPKAQSQEGAPKSSDARNALRAALLNAENTAPTRKSLTLFGQQIELLQPTLKQVMELKTEDPATVNAVMITRYIVVPGTEDRVFEEGDVPQIMKWAFGPDMARFAEAVNEMTGLDLDQEKEKLKADPLVVEFSNSPDV